MSQTISFVASDELADFLEEEAERQMTTVSSTAQRLLAERVREQRQSYSKPDDPEDGKKASERLQELEESGFLDDEAGEDDALGRYPDAWYRPNSEKHDYAVDVPEDAGVYDEGKTRYFKTRGGAAQAITRWYE